MDIKDKFGTDWIGRATRVRGDRPEADERAGSERSDADNPARGSSGSGSGSGFRSGNEENQVFLMLGKQIIRFLAETGGVDKLDNLAGKMKLEAGDLEGVVEWMASNYYIRVIPDKFGNHQILLTGKANELTGVPVSQS